MQVFPAIDIRDGQCVRLYKGDFDAQTVYPLSPVAQAAQFSQQGATGLHVVNLDAAEQSQSPDALFFQCIGRIVQSTGLCVQVGGGIRTASVIRAYFSSGVRRVVVGSIAIADPERVRHWFSLFDPERIVLALDVRIQAGVPWVVTQGWRHTSARTLWDVLEDYPQARHILCTDIEQDGTLTGPNFDLYQSCLRYRTQHGWRAFQASGGVAHIRDVAQLAAMGVDAVVIGKALYEKQCTLTDVLHTAGQAGRAAC